MVVLIETTQSLIERRKTETGPVGFVPTMGNLHAGHISLLNEALKDFDKVYFSIFVNPKQFGPTEDFNRYPRTLEQDLNLIKKLVEDLPGKAVIVYAPKDPKEVFPPGQSMTIAVEKLNAELEGAIRPGHFDGVSTVVHRLFQLIQPNRAYFGLKDYQQLLVIKQMVKDLLMPVDVVGMPIVREAEGLALSSRNQYLSPEEKKHSLILSRTLTEIKNIISGKRANIARARERIQNLLKDEHWNYLELRDAENLSTDLSGSKRITLLAVYQLGTTRLLDNLQMEIE